MHCMNVIWRDHHLSAFPQVKEFKTKNPESYEWHYDHCIDVVRKRLMCTGDTGVITFNLIRGLPFADFNTTHMCRDYNELLDWTRGRQVDGAIKDYWPGARA